VVQGISEFFPISSTAHLILVPWFFGWTGEVDTLSFDVALHGGTLVALIAYFYKDWMDLLFRDRRMLGLVVLGTIPAGVAGLLLEKAVEHTFRSPLIIVFTLVAVGAVMLAAEKYGQKHRTSTGSLTTADALVIGFAQAVALVPGVSRSGITITAGMFRDLSREAATRFSFLLSTPIIAGATVLHFVKMARAHEQYDVGLFAAGFIAAAVSGFFAIGFLMNYLRRHPLHFFVYYRWALAAVVFVFWAINR
jgi:undecaprenyl-diphosphatase